MRKRIESEEIFNLLNVTIFCLDAYRKPRLWSVCHLRSLSSVSTLLVIQSVLSAGGSCTLRLYM